MTRSPERDLAAATAVVFDGDDTLWITEPLYDQARSRAGAIVASVGLNSEEWEAIERPLDVANVKTHGYSALRFPLSCVQAYQQLCAAKGVQVDPLVADRVASAARGVFESTPELLPGAREVLSTLAAKGVRLALLTKGDEDVQKRRIETSGLGMLFDYVRIVDNKTPDVFAEVVDTLGADVDTSWTVGNSVPSDIIPGIAAGLRAVWIDAHVWIHERTDQTVDDRVLKLPSLDELLSLVTASYLDVQAVERRDGSSQP